MPDGRPARRLYDRAPIAASPISRSARAVFRARCARSSAIGSGDGISPSWSVLRRRRLRARPHAGRRAGTWAHRRSSRCSRFAAASSTGAIAARRWDRGGAVLRCNAAVALGNELDRSAVPALCESLHDDPHPMVRGHVAWALGRIGSPRRKRRCSGGARRDASVREDRARSAARMMLLDGDAALLGGRGDDPMPRVHSDDARARRDALVPFLAVDLRGRRPITRRPTRTRSVFASGGSPLAANSSSKLSAHIDAPLGIEEQRIYRDVDSPTTAAPRSSSSCRARPVTSRVSMPSSTIVPRRLPPCEWNYSNGGYHEIEQRLRPHRAADYMVDFANRPCRGARIRCRPQLDARKPMRSTRIGSRYTCSKLGDGDLAHRRIRPARSRLVSPSPINATCAASTACPKAVCRGCSATKS